MEPSIAISENSMALSGCDLASRTTSVCAEATAPELEGRGGLYLEDCDAAEVDDAENAPHGVRS